MIINKDEMKALDAQKAYEVLERVHKFLGILIRENLVKDAPFLDEGELENESDLADDVWEVLQTKQRNCDVHTVDELKAIFNSELISELPIANEHEKNLAAITAMGVIDTLLAPATAKEGGAI